MKRIAAITLLLAFAAPLAHAAEPAKPAAAAPAAAPYTGNIKELNRAAIDALLAKPDQLLILDVRRPDELTKIGGFPVYLSIQLSDVEKNIALIPKGRTILTVSNHAHRAQRAGDVLEKHGYKVAGAAGVQNYEAEGGKLTKIEAPAPKAAAAN